MTIEQIEDGVVVSLAYVMTVDGKEIERAERESPLDYLHGAENIIPGLEQALTGKRVGEQFSVTLLPEDAYGERDENNVQAIAREDIDDADILQPGMMVEIEDEDDHLFQAAVVEITADAVVLDFNDELAGKSLTYDVEVVALRAANADELDHGHPHGPDGHHDHH